MNTERKLLHVFFVLFLFALPGCTDKAPKEMSVTLSIGDTYLTNAKANPLEVGGYPVNVTVTMKEDGPRRSGYYVHLFQMEVGAGVKYYYQGSTPFIAGSAVALPVWLGSNSDISKNYMIYVVLNKKDRYEKDQRGIASFDKLPGEPIAFLQLLRTR